MSVHQLHKPADDGGLSREEVIERLAADAVAVIVRAMQLMLSPPGVTASAPVADTPAPINNLITAKQAAVELKTSHKTIERLVRDWPFAHKVRGQWRIDRAAMLRWVARQ